MAIFSLRANIALSGAHEPDFSRTYGVIVPGGFVPTEDDIFRFAGLIADRYLDAGPVCVSEIEALGCDVSVPSLMLNAA